MLNISKFSTVVVHDSLKGTLSLVYNQRGNMYVLSLLYSPCLFFLMGKIGKSLCCPPSRGYYMFRKSMETATEMDEI